MAVVKLENLNLRKIRFVSILIIQQVEAPSLTSSEAVLDALPNVEHQIIEPTVMIGNDEPLRKSQRERRLPYMLII